MATALAAVRLQRPHHDGVDTVHKYMEALHGMRELGSSGVSVRAFGGYPSKGVASQSRRRICRVPLFRTPSSSPRREALISAMSEEHDITDMQETDKVSGEWWKPILTAVHDWSQEKLLGLAELADGSLFFSFGPGSGSPAKASPSPRPKAQAEANNKLNNSSTTHNNLPPKTLPQRHPSSFRKHSPIPAMRKKASNTGKQAPKEADDNKPQKPKDPTPHPQRPPYAFSKRSPIPKDRVIKQQSQESPAIEAQEVQPAATIDSPFSPELKQILDQGKQTADNKESVNSNKSDAAAPGAKKKASSSSKLSSEETVVDVVAQGAKKKTSSRTESEETVVEVVGVVPNWVTLSKDLGSYKLPELRSLAKARGLKGYSKLKKSELVDLLAGLES